MKLIFYFKYDIKKKKRTFGFKKEFFKLGDISTKLGKQN